MTQKELRTLFDLAEKLYQQEQKKSGMLTPMPYAYAEGEGKFLAISIHGPHSSSMKKKLKELDLAHLLF